MRLGDLAAKLGGTLTGDAGDERGPAAALEITRVATLESAGPGDVTFLSNPKYRRQVAATKASAIIAGPSLTSAPCPIIRVDEPYVAFATAVGLLAAVPPAVRGVNAQASVDVSAKIAATASIGPFVAIAAGVSIGPRTVIHPHAVIGRGASIGADCVIHAHVSVREHVQLGDRVVVQDGAVIGSDGFGFATAKDGTHHKIPQLGRVVIEDDVEIGAQSAIDRPAIGETRIMAGTKIDNLVQIAHGVRVGRGVLLAAQVGIAGSTVIGDRAIFAGQSGAVGHVKVGAGAIVTAKSGVTHDVPDGAAVSGFPAFDLAQWKQATVAFRRLSPARRRKR
jgi:UDP-3-O-[3-hydroxymyristoyl] glucosamine N-acyltransferase